MVHLDLWKAMSTQENHVLRPELCQTTPWTVPDYALNCARLHFELCQTALWNMPDCALNCARLCFELCQTAVWTVPDCALNCARLRFELRHTALWTVPDCSLNCARQRRFRRLTVTGSGVQTDGAMKLNQLLPTDFTLDLKLLKSFLPEDQRACDWYVQNAAER